MPTPVSISGLYINASTYGTSEANLLSADAAAHSAGVGLNVDIDYTLTAARVLDADPVLFTNGHITRGSNTLRVNGRILADDYQRLFDAAGTGLVTPAKNADISAYWFGAAGDGTVDDTNPSQQAINAAQAASSALSSTGAAVAVGGTVTWYNGKFKWTSTVTGSSMNMSYLGSGKGSTVIVFAPTADGPALKLSTGGASQINYNRISGFTFWSADTTYDERAIDLVDVSVCEVCDIHIHGGYAAALGNYWHGGANGSIGILTQGRDQTSVHDVYIAADLPIYVAANPNAARADCEDMDHWHWSNMYLLPLGNYAFTVADGIGLDATIIDGYQAWVGGTGGFKMNDTRTGSYLPTRDLRIANVRTEQQTDPNGFAINIGSTANAVVNVMVENCTLGVDMQGLSFGTVQSIILDSISAATATGKTCLTVGTPQAFNSVTMRGCIWQHGSVFSLSGYISSDIPASYSDPHAGGGSTPPPAGPFNATYVAAPGATNYDFRYSAQEQNGVRRLKWAFPLASGASPLLLAANIAAQGVSNVTMRVTGVGGAVVEGGMAAGPNTTPALVKLSGSANFAATSSASNLCVYVDGSTNLWVVNNTAVTLNIVAVAEATF